MPACPRLPDGTHSLRPEQVLPPIAGESLFSVEVNSRVRKPGKIPRPPPRMVWGLTGRSGTRREAAAGGASARRAWPLKAAAQQRAPPGLKTGSELRPQPAREQAESSWASHGTLCAPVPSLGGHYPACSACIQGHQKMTGGGRRSGYPAVWSQPSLPEKEQEGSLTWPH